MAKTKNKFATGSSFSVDVCDTLRFHIGSREVAENNRKNAFSDRDAALEEINECEDKESPEYIRAERNHSEAIRRIDSLSVEISWHNKQIGVIVANADKPQQLELSLDMPEPELKKKPDPDQMKFGDGEKKVKPVGRPGPVKPEHPDASLGDGVAEHLKVSVLELDLPEKLKGKVQRLGYETVGSLIAAIDEKGYSNPMNEVYRDLFEVSSKDAAAIVEAAWAFKKKHVNAELAKIREEEAGGNEASAGGLKLVGTAANAKPGKGAKKAKEAIL